MTFLFQIILIVAGYEYISWRIKSKKSIKDWWDGYNGKERIYEIGALSSGTFSLILIMSTVASHLFFIYGIGEVGMLGLWMPIISYPAIAICIFCVIKKNELSK